MGALFTTQQGIIYNTKATKGGFPFPEGEVPLQLVATPTTGFRIRAFSVGRGSVMRKLLALGGLKEKVRSEPATAVKGQCRVCKVGRACSGLRAVRRGSAAVSLSVRARALSFAPPLSLPMAARAGMEGRVYLARRWRLSALRTDYALSGPCWLRPRGPKHLQRKSPHYSRHALPRSCRSRTPSPHTSAIGCVRVRSRVLKSGSS